MMNPKMEAENRKANRHRRAATRRKPFADCTNTPTITSTRSSSSSTNPITKLPSSPLLSSFSSGTANREVFEPGSVYSRRHSADARKSKGKEIAGLKKNAYSPSPGNPLATPCNKLTVVEGDTLSKSMTEDGGKALSKFLTEPCKKRRRRESHKDVQKHGLPQEFIEKQNAYFAEIDAFELPVEVASDDELD